MCFLNDLIMLKHLYEKWNMKYEMNMKRKESKEYEKKGNLGGCEQVYGKLWYVTLVSGDI